MAPRRKCPVCGSKQWHKDSSSGLVACSEGHVIQNYRNESGETQDLGNYSHEEAHSKIRPSEERQGRAEPILSRKQIAALIALWDLPPEFEVGVPRLFAG
ncbi:hypothetical protein DFH29DRAFT_885501, partial [Suillus ampliporus]